MLFFSNRKSSWSRSGAKADDYITANLGDKGKSNWYQGDTITLKRFRGFLLELYELRILGISSF